MTLTELAEALANAAGFPGAADAQIAITIWGEYKGTVMDVEISKHGDICLVVGFEPEAPKTIKVKAAKPKKAEPKSGPVILDTDDYAFDDEIPF